MESLGAGKGGGKERPERLQMMRTDKAERNIVEAELHGSAARVRVQTYDYEVPSEQVRCPSQHQLALLVTRRADGPRSYLGRLHSGQTFSLGSLLYIPAGQWVWGGGPGGPHRMVTCAYPAGTNRALAPFERGWDDEGLARCANIRSDWIVEAMRRLGNEAANPGFGSDILLDGLADALAVELVRQIQARPAPATAVKGGLSPHQLRKVEDHVRDWPAGSIKVADLAELVGLSRGHFMRAFKQSTGKTVHALVEEIRLDIAKDLLIGGRMPLKQIAARLGFADPSSFSLAFRRMTGVAPGRYRAERGSIS